MKICPYCRTGNTNESIICKACSSHLSKAEIVADLPKPKKKSKQPRKSPEYVQLYHGPVVKKSTAKYLARKNKEIMQWVWAWFIFVAILGILSRCS